MFRVQMFQGIGDTLYQKHFIKRIAEIKGEIAVATPWPQLLWDVPNIKFWWQDTMLRTQEKNMLALPKSTWAPIHKKVHADLSLGYDDRHLATGMTIPQSFAKKIKQDGGMDITDYSVDLELKPEWLAKADEIVKGRKICLVRPPTVRREWAAPSRNPAPGVMSKIIARLPSDYVTLGVSYNEATHEWPVEKIKVHESYEEGQLPIEIVAALMKRAALVVAPVGFATVMSLAVKAKIINVYGGHVAPEHILDPRMDLTGHHVLAPSPFCDCFNLQHECKKDISDTEIDRVLTNAIR